MAAAACVTLISAVLGATGTAVLFKGSFAFEPIPGMSWGGPDLAQYNLGIIANNKRRLNLQRAGLVLLLISFFVQGLGAVL